jgi:F-type H+-transporting ATPase subunit delta
MATISTNNLARAIYESSLGKSGGELDVVAKNAVDLIGKKHLMSKSKEILTALEKIIDKNEEVVRAKISSRVKLEKKIVDEIEDFIKSRYKAKNTFLEFEVDAQLLGGIKIEIGDEIIDTTIKSKIHKLENYLITQ